MLLIFWQKHPGGFILLGSVLGWSLLGSGLRSMGVADPAAAVTAATGGGLTTIGLDWRYRVKHGMGPFDLSASTILTIFPTWVWGVLLLTMIPRLLAG